MKNNLQVLKNLSESLDLDMFYSIRIDEFNLTIQGYQSDKIKQGLSAFCKLTETEYSWLEGTFVYDGVSFSVVLTQNIK